MKLLLAAILTLACAAAGAGFPRWIGTNLVDETIILKVPAYTNYPDDPVRHLQELKRAVRAGDMPYAWVEEFERSIIATDLRLVLGTNWTGATTKDGEVGLIVTNHVLHVEYKGTTNDFTLLTVDSGRHVFRKQEPEIFIHTVYPTNYYFWTPPTQIPLLTNWSIVQ